MGECAWCASSASPKTAGYNHPMRVHTWRLAFGAAALVYAAICFLVPQWILDANEICIGLPLVLGLYVLARKAGLA
jgi:hypothetical protein